MKKYKKVLGIITVVAAIPLMAAENSTIIKVNTYADEDLDNDLCSLREAIITVEKSKSYHGCNLPAINTQYTIQLESGTYNLEKGELVPKNSLTIQGTNLIDWTKIGILSGEYPAPKAIETRINVGGKFRIFNTAVGKQPLVLNNIILENGKASDVGGAIYAGSNVNLQNTQILNSQAPRGGAIYLGAANSELIIFHSLLQGNGLNTSAGSVIAMSCMFNNLYTTHKITFDSNSIIKNGTSSSLSTFEFCGAPTITFENNTIAQNTANLTNGAILKFTGDADPQQNQKTNLSSTSSLNLKNNTIVDNTANTVFLYDKLGKKDLSFNVLAFNSGSFACRYLLGPATDEKDARILLKFNALKLSGSNEKCDMPSETLPSGHTNIDVSSKVLIQLLERQESSESTSFLPIYYPKNNQQSDDLVDVDLKNEGECSSFDQRRLIRSTSSSTDQTVDNSNNKCDIGSVEQTKLAIITTDDDATSSIVNSSLTDLLNKYQLGIDQTKADLANPAFTLQEAALKINLSTFENLFKQTKENLKYRGIYVDLKNYYSDFNNGNINKVNIIPYEDINHVIIPFKPDNYDIDVKVIGKGQTLETATEDEAKSLKCEWNPSLKQIILYRTDDTPSGDDFEFCKYTVILKSNRNITATGIIKASLVNIPPVSENATVTFKYLANEIIPLNMLKYANDEGDGPTNTLITKPNKPQFADLPIYLPSKVSEDGIFKVIKADREGPCPGKDSKNTCYGGNIYIQAKNVFNTFNDTLTYYVYDADGTISAKAGTINLVNTATTTDDSRGGGGGGSIGILSIASLLSLIAYRRYRK